MVGERKGLGAPRLIVQDCCLFASYFANGATSCCVRGRYRARVIKVNPDRSAEVLYVDFGNVSSTRREVNGFGT